MKIIIIKISIITISLIFSSILFASISWFENEERKIVKMDKENIRNIRKLRKISRIGSWLDENVKPFIISVPEENSVAEENLVKYFDKNAKKLNFKVTKYIYNDENSKFLDVSYWVDRSDKAQLEALSKVHYAKGFLQVNELNVRGNKISGRLHIIQPYYGDEEENRDDEEIGEDDVPQ